MHAWKVLTWIGAALLALVILDFIILGLIFICRKVRGKRDVRARHRAWDEEGKRASALAAAEAEIRTERAGRTAEAGRFMEEGFDRIIDRIEKGSES